jgi:hypothetical protein
LLCCAVPSTAELIRHEDHFDRVPVWDATRSNGWENHNHYSGGYGGHGHGRWLKSEKAEETKSEQQSDNTPQEITPTAGDKEDGNSRNLLGAQEWGSGMFCTRLFNCNCLHSTAAQVAHPQLLNIAICCSREAETAS